MVVLTQRQDDWTPETKEAWVEAYGVITDVMLDGADYSSESAAGSPAPYGNA